MKLFLMVAMLVALAFGGPASALVRCGVYTDMIMKLDMRYNETRYGAGLSGPNSAFEIWASNEKPYTWTILKVFPNGKACLMASGEGWQTDPPVPPGDPA